MTKHILIQSNGRSGSNILLDTMDLAASTHCRNEPSMYEGSPLQQKILGAPPDVIDETMSQYWDEAADWMSCRWGHRDRHHPYAQSKVYYRDPWWKLRLPQYLISKTRFRRAFSIVCPELKKEEFRLPSWLMRRDWQDSAVHVFKVGASLEAHLPWILKNRPAIRIINLVRHPLGFAQSLYRRLYEQGDKNDYHQKNLELLTSRLQFAQQHGVEFPAIDVESLDLFESVIWNWIVLNETAYQLYRSQPAVLTVAYERLLAEPVVQMKEVFDHCGIPWDEKIEPAIEKTYEKSAHLAQSFREYWSEEQQQMVERLLEQTAIGSLWKNQLWQQLTNLSSQQKASEVSYSPY